MEACGLVSGMHSSEDVDSASRNSKRCLSSRSSREIGPEIGHEIGPEAPTHEPDDSFESWIEGVKLPSGAAASSSLEKESECACCQRLQSGRCGCRKPQQRGNCTAGDLRGRAGRAALSARDGACPCDQHESAKRYAERVVWLELADGDGDGHPDGPHRAHDSAHRSTNGRDGAHDSAHRSAHGRYGQCDSGGGEGDATSGDGGDGYHADPASDAAAAACSR
jgi:hypothetical protein